MMGLWVDDLIYWRLLFKIQLRLWWRVNKKLNGSHAKSDTFDERKSWKLKKFFEGGVTAPSHIDSNYIRSGDVFIILSDTCRSQTFLYKLSFSDVLMPHAFRGSIKKDSRWIKNFFNLWRFPSKSLRNLDFIKPRTAAGDTEFMDFYYIFLQSNQWLFYWQFRYLVWRVFCIFRTCFALPSPTSHFPSNHST